jgi:hypothetical protein
MKFEYIIESDDFAQTLQCTKTALEQLGYRLQSDAGRTWVYVRGSFWSALFALTPKSWQSTVVIEQVPSGLQVRLMIKMEEKNLLPAGARYWQKEIDFICRSAAGESVAVEKVKFERPPILKPLALLGVIFALISLGSFFAVMTQSVIVSRVIWFFTLIAIGQIFRILINSLIK